MRDLEVHNNFQSFIVLIWWFYTRSRVYLQDLAMRWLQFINTALLFKREIKIEMSWQSTHSCTLQFIMQYTNRNSLFCKLVQVPQIYSSIIDRPVTQGNPAKRCCSHGSEKPTEVTTNEYESHQCEHHAPHHAPGFYLVDFLSVGTWKMPHLPGRLVTANMQP